MFFDDVRLPSTALLGQANKGFYYLMQVRVCCLMQVRGRCLMQVRVCCLMQVRGRCLMQVRGRCLVQVRIYYVMQVRSKGCVLSSCKWMFALCRSCRRSDC